MDDVPPSSHRSSLPHLRVTIAQANDEPPIGLQARSRNTEIDSDDDDLEVEPREGEEDEKKGIEKGGKRSLFRRIYDQIKVHLSWIPANCTWSSLKVLISSII